jgi:hypothetical protein
VSLLGGKSDGTITIPSVVSASPFFLACKYNFSRTPYLSRLTTPLGTVISADQTITFGRSVDFTII